VLPHPGGWQSAGVLAAMEAYRHPFETARGQAAAGTPVADRLGLEIRGDGVVLTALRRCDAELELRLVAETTARTTALVAVAGGVGAARNVDLLGRPGDELKVQPDESLAVDLGPWEIRTIRIQPRSSGQSAAPPRG
jgi:mannosylglycerate hydrolase